ncbi:hypothetical protein QSJ19_13885 [Gordonia sp. ABSL11-1]|uniref:hypothetical protein n=1 Tax=Gordonia sp. ABSL11-1 TaxID=3053924 RepID=UPI0025735C28|nr:hypothetical protein [Gordonia sp. ABSL11-1]MDL9946659.1 hypothetical protein [Gordonia sp. ABSL11-1]
MAEFDYDANDDGRASASGVSIATILASAGVAAIVSALIVSIGVVGILVADQRAGEASGAQTPTVVNLGAAGPATPAGAAPNVVVPGNAAPAQDAPPAGQAPAGEQVPESDGGAGAGTSAAPPAEAPQGGAAPVPPTAGPAQPAPAASSPAALTPGQLNTKIKLIMNTGAARAARANELQSGERGLRSIDQVAQMLRVSGAGFTYQMIGPVRLNGTSLSATLQMSLVGNGSRYRQLTWVWSGNKWKLSDRSVCDVAAYALIPCSV